MAQVSVKVSQARNFTQYGTQIQDLENETLPPPNRPVRVSLEHRGPSWPELGPRKPSQFWNPDVGVRTGVGARFFLNGAAPLARSPASTWKGRPPWLVPEPRPWSLPDLLQATRPKES